MNAPPESIPLASASRDEAQATFQLRIARSAYRAMLETLMSKPVEAGGILLGPIGADDITEFYFDAGAVCTGATYSPDHVALNQLLNEIWIPSGCDWKGFGHTHPRGADRLSTGDLRYIRRLLRSNEDMAQFAAPLVIPGAYQLLPFVVPRAEPEKPRLAQLILF